MWFYFLGNVQSQVHTLFDVIHFDVSGPSFVTYVLGHRYFITLIDEFSMCMWIFLLKERS